jgi:nicotinate-nucleotide adenylyltransferase
LQDAIGILGGTFDPIHFGHLRLAQEMAESLGLKAVRFIPAARPPHRVEPHCAALHRAEMVRLAIAGNPLFTLDLREFDREGPSYMVETLASLRAEIGHATPLFLLLGADAFLGIHSWHRWQELFDLAHVAVAYRPGFVLDAEDPGMQPALRSEWLRRYCDGVPETACGAILMREITALDISASNIRIRLGHGSSPRYLLPEAVCDYIHIHQLYEKKPHGT